jgi:hypothetical protein
MLLPVVVTVPGMLLTQMHGGGMDDMQTNNMPDKGALEIDTL